MNSNQRLDRFKNLTFDDFRTMAKDSSLSEYEKIGFPDSYREGKGELIFSDIRQKLTNLERPGQVVLDIGPGCSQLPRLMIDLCRTKGHTLILVDAEEMLALLPDEPFIKKVPAYYPNECAQLFTEYLAGVDVILAYSVFQIVFAEGNPYHFVDKTLSLMAHRAQWLMGDIPSYSKRQRFFSSPEGVRFHQQTMLTDDLPSVTFNALHEGEIDDSVLLSLMLRCRIAGFDSYLIPQNDALPMSNRREDLLVVKP